MINDSSSFDLVGELPVDLMVSPRTKLFFYWNRWRSMTENDRMFSRVKSCFGNVELATENDWKESKAVIFLSCSDGTIEQVMLTRLNHFFERDKAEALVFEYNPFENTFQSRTLDDLCKRVA